MQEFDPNQYSKAELRRIADYVYELLGIKQGKDLNLEDELVEHLQICKQAREVIMGKMMSGDVPPSAAACLNAVTSSLKEVVRMQVEVNNAEKVKLLTKVVVDNLSGLPNAAEILDKIETGVRRGL